MLVCISPAKKLDWSEAPRSDVTTPDFSADALKLAKTARDLSVPQLQKVDVDQRKPGAAEPRALRGLCGQAS